MSRVQLFPSQIHMLKSSLPAPENMTWFGNGVFTEGIMLKWGYRGALIQSDCTLIRRGRWDMDTHGGMIMWRDRQETAVCRLRTEAWNTPFPCNPQKEPALLTPWFWIYSFQNCVMLNFCCVCHPFLGNFSGNGKQRTNTKNDNSRKNSFQNKIWNEYWRSTLCTWGSLTQEWSQPWDVV